MLPVIIPVLNGCAALESKIGRNVQPKTFSIDKLWVRSTLQSDFYGFRRPHRMSPIIYGNYLIQGNGIDGIGAYQAKTGHQKWFLPIPGGVEAGAAINKDRIFAGGSDGFFYSINAQTGSVNWKTPLQVETLSEPTFHENIIYFIAGNNRFYALEGDSGKILWSYSRQETSNLSIRGGSQPTIYKNTAYIGFSDGVLVAVDISNGKPKWERSLNKNKKFRDIDSRPMIENDKIYVTAFDEGLSCLDVETGKVLWQHDQGGFSAVTLHQDRVFYSTTDGEMLSLDKTSGKVLWSYRLKNTLATQPEIYKGLIVFGEYEGDIVALDAESGRPVGKYSTGRGVMGKPTIDGKSGNLYFISVNANLYALKLEWTHTGDKWPWEKVL